MHRLCETAAMTANHTHDETYPYSLEVALRSGSDRDFQWAIRKAGKLLERGDRNYFSEEKARSAGLAAIERIRMTGNGARW